MTSKPQVTHLPGAQRHHWWNEWLDSKQSFPATGNYDLAANAHGLLMVHNEDTVFPGEGFDSHQHENMEIVTWVLEGTLKHTDSEGNSGLIYPGLVQRMSAGTGIRHTETNASSRTSREKLRVVQMWIPPDTDGTDPSYEELDVQDQLANGELVPVASGMPGRGGVRIGNRYATLHAARLAPGESVTVPDAPYGHVFVADGSAVFETVGDVAQGDAVRLTATGGYRVTASTASEILIWEMHAGFA
ncbi:pirin family protein [Rhodococcus fascians]|nr:pirin family protein [Rhodococcus fascians]MBY4139805.1 pirin family protein [Rhodococcus fascians]MBY4216613.1 pirin family protein [Rhodococcus fascians]MBY4224240.1 pirin family protein [Rhodococcus fascians]MBY4230316.1 pirin family protein [Rhodococcus fascians]